MKNDGKRGVVLATCGLVLFAFVAQGCREEEQGRPLNFDKGSYAGGPDRALTAEELATLRYRSRQQQGLD